MVCLAGVSTCHKGPAKQQTGVALLGGYITAHDPSMACLLKAAWAILGPSGIFK